MIKASKYFIDASVWIALVLQKDSLHQKAIKITKKILVSPNQIYTSDYVLDETATRIKRKDEGETAKNFLSALSTQKIQVLFTNKKLFHQTIKMFNKHQAPKSFSFTDASIIVALKHHKIKNLLTFDQDLQALAKKYKIITIC